uniref:uncharacterized protein n=1 Tax=Semicossyphus pulcher TaxID=241346 RepID=UPI0037E7E879
MMSLTLITALLFTFSWMSVSVSEFHTVEVQPGEEVTLLCSNFSRFPTHIGWFKLNSTSNVSRISMMISSEGNVSFFDEFQSSKFDVTSNSIHLFLKINQVDLNDSGLYFCGFYTNEDPVIVSGTYLKVQEVFVGRSCQTSVILGALIVCLAIVFIALVVIIRKLQTAPKEEQSPRHSENLGSDDLNYAALSFHPKAKSSRRPAGENQLETHVVYAATR